MAFIGKLQDDLGTVVNVDEKRVYACGMSNGGMMCYRLGVSNEGTTGCEASTLKRNQFQRFVVILLCCFEVLKRRLHVRQSPQHVDVGCKFSRNQAGGEIVAGLRRPAELQIAHP